MFLRKQKAFYFRFTVYLYTEHCKFEEHKILCFMKKSVKRIEKKSLKYGFYIQKRNKCVVFELQ